MPYRPPEKILAKYAQVLVNFALNNGQGVKKGEVVFLQVSEAAKPLLIHLRRQALLAGAHPIIQYLPEGLEREFFELATKGQLLFFPKKYLKGIVEQADHFVSVLSETNKYELEGIAPQKILQRSRAFAPYKRWREAKENQGKLSWTLALYATPAEAKEAGLTLKEYWRQIIRACFLDFPDPVKKWREVFAQIEQTKNRLNQLAIEEIEVRAKDTNLTIGIGANRQWIGGSGANIPSFEIFTAPNCRLINGKVYFNQPLYVFGQLIKDVHLEFKNGRVVLARAQRGQKALEEIIKTPGANRVGEFSLTDGRLSRITHFMAETLYDENRGGRNGNFHLALGSAYQECYQGKNRKKLKAKDWQKLGFNRSPLHLDFVSTQNRVVTACLKNGRKKIIYQNGQFKK